jgi:hypothetical protein
MKREKEERGRKGNNKGRGGALGGATPSPAEQR